MNPGYLYLALQIAGSVSFGHVMKWSLYRKRRLAAVGAINYVVGSLMGLAYALGAHSAGLTPEGAWAGVLGGLSFVITFYFYYQAVRLTGVSVSTAVSRLAVLPAAAASILIWGERPALHQVAGIALVLVALPLLSRQPGDKSAQIAGPVWGWLLILLVLGSGGNLAAKLFQEVGTPLAKPLLLAVWFGVAAAVAVGVLVYQRLGPTRDDWPLGILLGAVNVVANFALISALEHLPGAIVFPVASAGGVLVAVVSSAVIWHERLSRWALAGVVVAIPALVLMNLP